MKRHIPYFTIITSALLLAEMSLHNTGYCGILVFFAISADVFNRIYDHDNRHN
jgi:hypothetical protein